MEGVRCVCVGVPMHAHVQPFIMFELMPYFDCLSNTIPTQPVAYGASFSVHSAVVVVPGLWCLHLIPPPPPPPPPPQNPFPPPPPPPIFLHHCWIRVARSHD